MKGGDTVAKKVTPKRKFWAFKALANNEGELTIYGEIANSQGGWFSNGNEVTPTSFKAELDALGDITTLNVYMNSPGGDIFAGQTIYSQLKRHKATINMHIDGLAASIASVIAMAGDTVHMPVNAMMMIHHPMSGVYGNALEMRAMADTLDKVCESIQETYLAKASGITREDLGVLLDSESWLTAQECLDLGLCDVVGEEKAISAAQPKDHTKVLWKNNSEFLTAVFNASKQGVAPDPRLLMQNAASGMGESVPSDGGFLVGEDFAKELLQRTYETGILASKCRKIPISPTSNSLEANGIDETSRANGSRWGGIQSYSV